MESKKRKKTAGMTAAVLALAIALTGTFAWQSISQTALNEKEGTVNPGGRLHDDFNGETKDIYVENFTKKAEAGIPIYARIRLYEYMEYGTDAGNKTKTDRNVTSLAGGDINDTATWRLHKLNETDNPFSDYWDWSMGGSTTYMPTFNMNKDSLKADINGTLEGKNGTPYDDYVDYTVTKTIENDEIYDADTDDTDEGDSAVPDTDITIVEKQTHTAKPTLEGSVISMQQWIDDGKQPGKYWVYDSDGWAYWAEAILPETATGLLLDGIALKKTPKDNWYYGINVVGQFVTAEDLGKGNNSGFYKDGNPTKEAETLLATIINAQDATQKIAELEDKKNNATSQGAKDLYQQAIAYIQKDYTITDTSNAIEAAGDQAEKQVSDDPTLVTTTIDLNTVITDSVILNEVKTLCDSEDGIVSKDKLQSVYTLDLSKKGVTSFGGLTPDKFPNLKEIDAMGNFTDMSVVDAMDHDMKKQLTRLNIGGPLDDSAGLSGAVDLSAFTSLKYLDIYHCPNMTSLTGLSSTLITIDMYANTGLTSLDLRNTKNLHSLFGSNCTKLSEVQGLGTLKKLQLLEFGGNSMTTIDISGCENLAAMQFGNNTKLKEVKMPTVKVTKDDPNRMDGKYDQKVMPFIVITGCSELASIDISNIMAVKTVDLSGCDKLTSVTKRSDQTLTNRPASLLDENITIKD